MKKLFFLLALVFAPFPLIAQVSPLRPGKIHFNASFSTITTRANFEDSGTSFKNLVNNQSLTVHQLTGRVDYNYSKKLNFYSSLGLANSISDDGSFLRNNTGLTKVILGSQYYFRRKKSLQIIPEFAVSIPLLKIATDTDDSFSHDGAYRVRLGASVQRFFWRTKHSLSWAYNYRDLGLSHFADYKYNIKFKISKMFFNFYFSGITTLLDDVFVQEPTQRTVITDRVNGSSLYAYSINPSSNSFGGSFEIPISRHSFIGFNIDSSFIGRNSAKGETFSLYLKMNNFLNTYSSKSLKERKRQKAIKSFKAEQEDYDESLFEAEEIEQGIEDKDSEELEF